MGWRRCSVRLIYGSARRLHEPVDMDNKRYYKEAGGRQILEEGSTRQLDVVVHRRQVLAYATHGINTIPFFIFYSMFGFQRVGDLGLGRVRHVDARFRARWHRWPHHAEWRGIAASGWPQPRACHTGSDLPVLDPAFAYELAVIIEDGIKRMRWAIRRRHLLLPDADERAVRTPPEPDGCATASSKGVSVSPTSKPTRGCARSVWQRYLPDLGSRSTEDSRRELTWVPTSGASRATSTCIAMAMLASAGIGCTRPTSHEVPYARRRP